jgi:hypothetical protein
MADNGEYSYHARIGGTDDSPTFCSDAGHEHSRVEQAAACLLRAGHGYLGEVYEAKDGVVTDTFCMYEKRSDGIKYSQQRSGARYRGLAVRT